MTFRQRVARALRKWADLIDPRTPPRESAGVFVCKVQIEGAEEFSQAIAKMGREMEGLSARGPRWMHPIADKMFADIEQFRAEARPPA